MNNQAYMLFGPTASGKTALAIDLAKHLNAVIINADSRQVYTDLPILTAMPTEEEFAAAPHKLFNFKSPMESFSAGDYAIAAKQAAEEVIAEGKTPFFVGGTGFYLRVLEEGLSPMPDVDKKTFDTYNKRLEKEGVDALYSELCEADPEWAGLIKPTDAQRTLRGLAVYHATGKPISAWQTMPQEGALNLSFTKIGLAPPRKKTVERINQRFQKMLDEGLVDEVKAFKKKYDVSKLPSKTIHGLREMSGHLEGLISLEEAAESITLQTRQYAKRQMTWMKNSYHADISVETPDAKIVIKKL